MLIFSYHSGSKAATLRDSKKRPDHDTRARVARARRNTPENGKPLSHSLVKKPKREARIAECTSVS